MSNPDVAVIGAGAIGAAAAHELTRRGARVVVLERSEGFAGCSYGNAGLICPSHAEALASPAAIRDGLGWMLKRDSPFHVRPRPAILPWLARFALASLPVRSARATASLRELAHASLALHAQLDVPTSFERRGILSVFASRAAFERARLGGGQALEPDDARAFEPALNGGLAGAVFHPDEAHCDPGRFVTALLEAARRDGAEVRTGVEILRMRRGDGRITELETTAGTLRPDAVVLAAGTWSRDLAREVGVRLPLEGAKGYHLELSEQPLESRLPIYMEEARVIATPLDGRLRIAGTLELSGLDLRVDHVRVGALRRAAERTLTLPAGTRTIRVWRGLRPCAPDGLPIIGRANGLENLFLATGHAMLGITLAPVTGAMVADQVTGVPSRYDLEPFAPARFRGAR